jgi:hypothetical protein
MNEQTLAQTLATAAALPTEADVILTQPLTPALLRARARQFIALLQRHEECPHDGRGAWKASADGITTTIHLPDGARATLYHASGALRYASGLDPAEAAFGQAPDRDSLQRLVEERARKLGLADWAGAGNELRFERLFRTLGQGADPTGKQSAATLFRAVGAYRQFVGGLPVLGAASVALKLAGDGRLDGLAVHVRPSAGEVLERAALVEPVVGARQIVQQLASVLGVRAVPGDIVQSAVLQLGYLDLGKRKPQRVLAPAYVAQIVLRHKDVRQAYVLAVAATEKPYLELPLFGTVATATAGRSEQHCKAHAA